ncbi:MAG: 2-oxoglutarate dehydrogenase E1 component [Phycisphaeraceae bacterium]
MQQAQHDLSVDYVESLYVDFLRDPASVSMDWQNYFRAMPNGRYVAATSPGGNGQGKGNGHAPAAAAPAAAALSRPPITAVPLTDMPSALSRGGLSTADFAALQHRVDQLVRNYRVRGHMVAKLDPIGMERPEVFELDPICCGITDEDFDRIISTDTIPGPDTMSVRQVIQKMRNTYCRSIGVQFMHIDSLLVRQWLIERMEGCENRIKLSRDDQMRILTRLTESVLFEEFIQKKYIGAKSFSLEGGETLIPLLDLAIEKAAEQGVAEIVMAMAHRGRLNVLANIMGKKPDAIFREFEDKVEPAYQGFAGDVKYHLGYSTDWRAAGNRKLHLSLCFNPSHLEFINPVALGRMRAKMDRCGDFDRKRGLVVLIHGDAAFSGEGISQETLNLSELSGYKVGGALHIVVNNQIGFTTTPDQGRSTVYATDVAKMLQIPIFHVNGEDPEAVAQVIRLALEFRARFQRDVVVDMYCFRRRGHNEGDEPSFTQPKLYQAIEKRKNVGASYREHLLALNEVKPEEADEIAAKHTAKLEEALKAARGEKLKPKREGLGAAWQGYVGGREADAPRVDTGVDQAKLTKLLDAATRVPEGFHVNPKVQRILETRRAMSTGEKPLDWAGAELLAFATLAVEGRRIRMTGQDVERGTFSHRHAMLHDIEDGGTWMPLKHVDPNQAPVDIINSPLSEAGVLGYEYGYSLDCPEGLILWEAQFGDFFNCAQVIIDQFITSAEDKWDRLSGITLLLPHGFEGQGPEHSSARIERWLVQGAEDNIQVCQPSTPAQYYHLLRRQVHRKLRKPLIVFNPKSLLRHPLAVSPISECATGRFQRVLHDELFKGGKKKPERVLMCSGRVYYDLVKRRDELKRDDVAIIRMEQLYPLPHEDLKEVLADVADGTPVYWIQDEPRNMGAWPHLRSNLGFILFGRLPFMGFHRAESASPATGSPGQHKAEQELILRQAFEEKVGYE